MYKCLLLMLMVALPTVSSATFFQRNAVVEDTLTIRFRLDSIRIDMDYADNRAAWGVFEKTFMEHFADANPRTLQLDIYSGASPEGPANHNRWLGENRGQAIRWLVRQRLPGRVGSIIVHNEGARWEGLFEAIAASDEPWRDEALHIIAMPATLDGPLRDHRETKLRSLWGGTAWPVLRDKYLAPLRSGATAILSWRERSDTVVVRDTVMMAAPQLLPSIIFADADGSLRRMSDSTEVAPPVVARNPKLRQPVWIARTNLPLLGFGGTPNLQLEFSLGHKDKWSFNIEGWWSWWVFSRNAYANEMIYGSIELRRWLGRRWRRHTLSGWHLGLAVGGGYGDLEWKSKGYQAEVYSGFLNFGYQGRFGKRKQWAFDMGIGLGYAYVPYRRYDGSTLYPVGKEERYDDHLMWQETRRLNWLGTPHFNMSIGYVFNQKNALWRRKKANERDAARNAVLFRRDSVIAYEHYQRDSMKVAKKLREKEIGFLPKTERKQAKQQLELEKKQLKQTEHQMRSEGKINARLQKKLAKINARQMKHQARQERDSIQQTLRQGKRYWKQMTPAERKKIKQEIKFEKLKEARKGQTARKQAKTDRKMTRIREKIDAEHQKYLERHRYKMEKADNKYKIK